MHRGLTMSDTEKARRHAALHKTVTTHTSHVWAAVLVRLLLGIVGARGLAKQTPVLPQDTIGAHYQAARKRLFLFDYDGTLTPIVKTPSMATPSEATLEALAKLTADPRNLVYIISGRDQEFLETYLGHFEKLGMSAEHGGFMREPGVTQWTNFTETLDMDWMGEVHEIFKYYTEVRWAMLTKARVCAHHRFAAHDRLAHRAQEELDHVALPGERP
jgi:trehalose 6-phosphate synthase/phosphatase